MWIRSITELTDLEVTIEVGLWSNTTIHIQCIQQKLTLVTPCIQHCFQAPPSVQIDWDDSLLYLGSVMDCNMPAVHVYHNTHYEDDCSTLPHNNITSTLETCTSILVF